MKRFLALTTATTVLAALALSSTSDAQSIKELALGSMAPKGTPWYAMMQDIEKVVEESSSIEVVIRPPGFMGELEMVEETRKGDRLQGCGVTTAALAQAGEIPTLQLIELPFLLRNNREADHILDNLMFDEMKPLMANKQLVLAAWSENGWRSFATKDKPIRTPDDLKGLRMRAQESKVHKEMYETFGATAIEKPMTEVLSALNQNTVDGLDNTALFILAGGLAEPLQHFTVTRHIYQPAAVVYSKTFYDSLSADERALLDQAKEFATARRRDIRQEEGEMMATFEAFDVNVIKLTADERKAFSDKATAMHRTFAAKVPGGTAMLNKINAELAKIR